MESGVRLKRRLLIVAVFLLAGAVVNVAVAWGCGLWYGVPQYRYIKSPNITRMNDTPPVDWWGEDPPEGFALHSTHGVLWNHMAGVEIASARSPLCQHD